MVVREGEINWTQGEVESALHRDEEANKIDVNNIISSSLGRQSSSIYSLTLDEFQHSLCESGKNFGSMNMDEFLSSIWNAEENQQAATNNNNNINNNNNLSVISKEISKQASLPRQNSLSIPAPLCRKTVEQVWSEIHKEQHQNNNNVGQITESATRQPTFGEMTLEDFLVKAGVVREQQSVMQPAALAVAPTVAAAVSSHRPQHYTVYPNNNSTMAAQAGSFAIGGGTGNVVAPPYQTVAQGGGAVGEPSGSGYVGNGKRDNIGTGYPPPPGVCYGGRVVNGGGGGYGVAVAQTMGMGGPVSPVSSDGIGNDNSGGKFGIDMSGLRGRKRMIDGPVERVVERRQRRMIKNRESAARSRARKQAYTVELEAELNQLREENSQLKQALTELERRRRQQCSEETNVRVQTKAQKAKEKLRTLRRNTSCHL
ncbi:protein ABSCISIC ACID-INSENSITIVE 5 isoform X1 [Cicer arietinum]|uniref:Protein ABSCISIC ACID-INSENSITIVE 5 isoform X1 n=1 Tax=Cicer arietinum TaxID=3827 RepID=A0A1S2XT79_CICAR|nr:protein ABSCISIC ACID-INSENSITIVE 5 isoform X1 [Cicer arietinum]XP_004494171.1 protein ABSCISIC ACID-INSENSITIVE 5 isoform X1 [Cicer arietinum]